MAVLLCPGALIKKHYILVLYHGCAAVSSCFDKKALYFSVIYHGRAACLRALIKKALYFSVIPGRAAVSSCFDNENTILVGVIRWPCRRVFVL